MDRAADVVVVGGGIAGLVATSLLHEQVGVVCLEARERVGPGVERGGLARPRRDVVLGRPVGDRRDGRVDGVVDLSQVLDGDALFEQPTGEVDRVAGNPIDRPAWRLDGGMQTLALELARRLPAGTVQTEMAVRRVGFEADGSVLVTTDAGTVSASAIVLAVPPALAVESIAFTPALPPGLIQAAQAVHTWMSDTVKVVARFEAPFWRDAGLAGAALSHVGPFCEFHDHSGPDADQAALFGFAPAVRLGGASTDEIAARFEEQVVRLLGSSAQRPDEIHIADWSSDPLTAATSPATPSSYWYYGTPVLRLPHLDGRLIFGSTETASAFPGYLEGAVLAGRRAAGQALDRTAKRAR